MEASVKAKASTSNKLVDVRWAAASKFWCSYSYDVMLADGLGGVRRMVGTKKSQNTKDGELGFFVVFLFFCIIQAWKELVEGGCWPASTWR